MGIKCDLVYDGMTVSVPKDMGTPRQDQLEGRPAEQLSELAGRVCYDSLGSGRNSKDYHKHILSVGHGSVMEHFHFTVQIRDKQSKFVEELLNRPGVFVRVLPDSIRVTVNLRAVIEWREANPESTSCEVGERMVAAARDVAPTIMGMTDTGIRPNENGWEILPPETEDEKWVTLFLCGSRGMSYEQVRHGDWTAISQRSTRFCDETGSEWVLHPLYSIYLNETKDEDLKDEVKFAVDTCRELYASMTHRLQDWISSKGVDKLTARKQARGAARGYLGNSLYTELVFSASVRQWKRMLKQRCSPGADAEIRKLYEDVLSILSKSRYGDSFSEFRLSDSPDGIGKVLV